MSEQQWDDISHHTSDMCAHAGSSAFFVSIPGSEVIVNGPLWCYFYAMRFVERSRYGAGAHFYCSQPDQNALVYGTEKDVLRSLETVMERKPERIFIENTVCIGLIGDDLKGIAVKADLPCPVYVLDSVGLSGGFAEGYEKAFACVFQEMESCETEPFAVNLLGATDCFLKGREDTEEMKRLLALSGYKVIAAPGAGSSWDGIMHSPAAALNVVVREDLGLKAAELMKKQFGIPYVTAGIPYGTEGTLSWLQKIAEALPGGRLQAVEEEAAGRKKRIAGASGEMRAMWGPLWFDRILVAAHGTEAASLAEAVRSEWADTGWLTILAPDESVRHFVTAAADEVLVCGQDDAAVGKLYTDWTGGLLMGSSIEAACLIREKRPFVSCHIAYPAYDSIFLTDQPLCGLRGAEYMCQRLWAAGIRQLQQAQKE